MATSSIFTNFTFTDEKSVEQFLNALDEAKKRPAWKPTTSDNSLICDPEEIRKLMANRKENI